MGIDHMHTISPGRFRPSLLLRNPHVQTVLSSSRVRIWRIGSDPQSTRPVILDAGEGVRLSGVLWLPKDRAAKALVILLHGWEGSAGSVYIRRTAVHLFRHGYAVFRLNYRDHGDSHHLNEGLFYASATDEVRAAVKAASQFSQGRPVFMVGFSLGGNFALRIGLQQQREPIADLRHIVCVSPVLDPCKATDRIDAIGYIRSYFLKKWRRSLLRKEAHYPDRYHFSTLVHHRTVRSLTDALLAEYSDFESTQAYFDRYTLLGDALKPLIGATTVITAADDPIIPVEDFYDLETGDRTRLVIHSHGGHNGFISDWSMRSWYEQCLVELFKQHCNLSECEYNGFKPVAPIHLNTRQSGTGGSA